MEADHLGLQPAFRNGCTWPLPLVSVRRTAGDAHTGCSGKRFWAVSTVAGAGEAPCFLLGLQDRAYIPRQNCRAGESRWYNFLRVELGSPFLIALVAMWSDPSTCC